MYVLAVAYAVSSSSDLVGLIRSTGPIAKLVLLVLLTASVISWAVIFYKFVVLKRAERANRRLINLFSKIEDLGELKRVALKLGEGPLCLLFLEGAKRMNFEEVPEAFQQESRLKSMERLLRSGIQDEMVHLEQYLPVLATVGGVTPFIGLFGTVWGIMDSFAEIGRQGTANIAAVAPGVAEALIATAAGLAAAIPAVIAYNFYVAKLRRMEMQMEVFTTELLSLVSEQWLKAKEKGPR